MAKTKDRLYDTMKPYVDRAARQRCHRRLGNRNLTATVIVGDEHQDNLARGCSTSSARRIQGEEGRAQHGLLLGGRTTCSSS